MRACSFAAASLLLRQTSSLTQRSFSASRAFRSNHNYRPLSMSAGCFQPMSKILTSPILGGDFAGLTAKFSSESGKIIPVPDHLVPESMLEWGDVPSYLETLASEHEIDVGMERVFITVLPEVGCGIDNLEATTQVQSLKLDETRMEIHGSGKLATVDTLKSTDRIELETIFQIYAGRTLDGDEGIISPSRRIRISITADLKRMNLSSDISMQVERRLSEKSTSGTRWTGPAYNSGGLDAGKVVNDIGKEIVNGDVFGVKKEKQEGDRWDVFPDLAGKWIQSHLPALSGPTSQKEVHRTCSDFGINSDVSAEFAAIRLPQNILVRYGKNLYIPGHDTDKHWSVEISRIDSYRGNLHRLAVCRSFDLENILIETTNSTHTTYCWVEDKLNS